MCDFHENPRFIKTRAMTVVLHAVTVHSYACTVKPHDILKDRNALVNSVR